MNTINFWINDEFYAVGFFSFLGVLMRLSITYSFTYDTADHDSSYSQVIEIFGDQNFLPSNILGRFIISFCDSQKTAIHNFDRPLYVGLTTGLCGCLTTFSTWLVVSSRNEIYNKLWIYVLIMIGVEFALTWCGFLLGYYVSPLWIQTCHALLPSTEKLNHVESSSTLKNPLLVDEAQSSSDQHEAVDDPLFMRNYKVYLWPTLFWIPAIIMWFCLVFQNNIDSLQESNAKKIFRAVSLAPFGVWLRWGLARIPFIVDLWPEMKSQTFIANVIAVICNGSLIICAPNWVWSSPIGSGIFGSVSTVSTFFLELYKMAKDEDKNGAFLAFRYGLGTFATAFFIVQIICAAQKSST